MPADPSREMLGQRTDSLSKSIINHDFALDQPPSVRFLIYLNDLLPLSVYNRKVKDSPIYLDPAKYKKAFKMFYFGADKAIVFKSPYLRRSYQNKDDVFLMLKSRFTESAILVVAAICIAVILGVLLGIISAIKKKSWIRKAIMSFANIVISLPVFFLAIVVAWVFGFLLHRYTGLNMTGGLYSIDPFAGEYINWKNLILPAIVLSIRPMALIIHQTQYLYKTVMNQHYIMTAKAKGIRRAMIILNHAWLNTTAPLLVLSHRWLGSMLAATLFVEFIFGWNGIGKLTVKAIDHADMPVLMGAVVFISVIYILLRMTAGLIYSTVDPRVDLQTKI